MAVLYEPADPSRAYYGTDARAHTLLVGAVLALVLTRRRPERRGSVIALHTAGVVAAAACAWAWVTASDQGSGLYHGGSFVFAIAVALVIASAVQPTRRSVWSPLRSLLSLGALRWVGLISYGLYLWHWPAKVILTETRTGLSGPALTVLRLGGHGRGGDALLLPGRAAHPARRAARMARTDRGTDRVRDRRGRRHGRDGRRDGGDTARERAGRPEADGHADPAGARVRLVGGAERCRGSAVSHPARRRLGSLHPASRPAARSRPSTGSLSTPPSSPAAGSSVVSRRTPTVDVPPTRAAARSCVDDYERSTLDRGHPDLVVWMSTWET